MSGPQQTDKLIEALMTADIDEMPGAQLKPFISEREPAPVDFDVKQLWLTTDPTKPGKNSSQGITRKAFQENKSNFEKIAKARRKNNHGK